MPERGSIGQARTMGDTEQHPVVIPCVNAHDLPAAISQVPFLGNKTRNNRDINKGKVRVDSPKGVA